MRTALMLFAFLLGCELCDHLEGGPQYQACEAQFARPCDTDGDGKGNGTAPCDAGVCQYGALQGVCV